MNQQVLLAVANAAAHQAAIDAMAANAALHQASMEALLLPNLTNNFRALQLELRSQRLPDQVRTFTG